MLTIIIKSLKDRKTSFVIYLLGVVSLIWVFISIYPMIQSQTANLEELLKFYPESMMKAFNVDIKSYTTAGGYISSEMFSFMWPIMIVALIAGYTGWAIAGEVEKGTIELLLSQPISRTKLFIGKYIAGFIIMLVFTLVSIYSIPAFLKAYNVSYYLSYYHTLAIVSVLYSWAIYSLGMFFSAIFSEKGKVFSLVGGLMVLMFVLNVIAGLKEKFVDLKYASFFYYFNATKILTTNSVDNLVYWVFGGVIILFSILAAVIFSKKNISI